MLRFFRLIRKKLLEDQRFRQYTYYAIGEIFLVVIGILIALQINNWNEDRKDQDRELAYLINYKLDLEKNLEELDRVIVETETEVVKTDSLIQVMTNAIDLEKGRRIDDLIMESTGYTIFQSHESTLQNIMGSGSLDLIKNREIRTSLSSWEGSLKMIRGWEVNTKSSFDQHVNYMKQHIPMYSIMRGESFDGADDWQAKVSEDLFFINLQQERIMISGVLNGLYLEKQAEIKELIVLLDQEIERLK